jgi:hypothetical protein
LPANAKATTASHVATTADRDSEDLLFHLTALAAAVLLGALLAVLA